MCSIANTSLIKTLHSQLCRRQVVVGELVCLSCYCMCGFELGTARCRESRGCVVTSRAGLIELLTAERLTDFTYACVDMNRLKED